MARLEASLSNRRLLTATLIAATLALFAGRSWRAVERENPTWDEPYHFLSGYTALRLQDYRLDTEHPNLWKYWAVLPDLFAGPYRIDTDASE